MCAYCRDCCTLVTCCRLLLSSSTGQSPNHRHSALQKSQLCLQALWCAVVHVANSAAMGHGSISPKG
jgi:hypothetical protein